MKRNLNLVILLIVSLFAGVFVANAAGSSLQFGTYSCNTLPEQQNGKMVTQCTITATATKTETLTATDHFEVRYAKRRNGYSGFEFAVESTNAGKISNKSAVSGNNDEVNSLGGTFDFTYSNLSVEAGKEYVLFEITIYGDPSLTGENEYVEISGRKVKACGGFVNRVASGENKVDDGGNTVKPNNTGFSIPVALIGVGSVAGLTIYSTTKRKPKMHRI